MSETQRLKDSTTKFRRAISELAAIVEGFKPTVDAVGVRARPSTWKQLEDALKILQTLPEDLTTLANIFSTLDGLERGFRLAKFASAAVTDPSVVFEVTANTSLTFAGSVKHTLARLDAAEKAAAAAAEEVGQSWGDVKEGVAAAQAAYRLADPRGGLSTDLYVEILRRAGSSAPLEAAKDSSVGATAAATEIPRVQVSAAVNYDFRPLVDLKTALEFGPLATSVSGLSYKVLQRLNTMTPAAPPGPPLKVRDRLEKYNSLAAPPAVLDYDPAAQETKKAEIDAKLEGVTATFPRYLELELAAELKHAENAAKAAAKASAVDDGKHADKKTRGAVGFLALAAPGGDPETDATPVESSYIAVAIGRATAPAIDREVLRPIFGLGRPAAAYDVAKEEAYISHAIATAAMAKLVARGLRDAAPADPREYGKAAATACAALAAPTASLKLATLTVDRQG